MPYRLAADLTVAVHLAFVAFVPAGGFLAWRWPKVLRFHLPAVAASAALAMAGLDCPLTDLETWLRRQAGDPGYRGGFIAHYLVEPVHPAGMTPAIRVGLRVFTITVVAVAYVGLLVRRAAAARAESAVREEQRPTFRSNTL